MGMKAQTFGQQAFDFIDGLSHFAGAEAVLAALDGITTRFGFERFIVTGIRPEPGQNFLDLVLAKRWPAEFVEMYNDRDYIRVDPNALRALNSSRPFEWSEQTCAKQANPRADDCMKLAADFRIACGYMVPIHGPGGYEACVGMSGVTLDLPAKAKPILHLIALYAFDRIRELTGRGHGQRPSLTNREREVLAWSAQGKSAWEIGEILTLAKRTVDEHAQTAIRKLGAANRTQAVAIALRHRLFEV